jgi:hypothetical protein
MLEMPQPRVSNEGDPKIGHKKIIDGMLINSKMKAKWKAFFANTRKMDFI